MMRRLIAGALLLLLAGCGSTSSMSTGHMLVDVVLYGPLGGLAVYGDAQYAKQVDAGTAPPLALLHHCNREGLVRGADGRWQPDGALTRTCFSEAGWRYTLQTGWQRDAR